MTAIRADAKLVHQAMTATAHLKFGRWLTFEQIYINAGYQMRMRLNHRLPACGFDHVRRVLVDEFDGFISQLISRVHVGQNEHLCHVADAQFAGQNSLTHALELLQLILNGSGQQLIGHLINPVRSARVDELDEFLKDGNLDVDDVHQLALFHEFRPEQIGKSGAPGDQNGFVSVELLAAHFKRHVAQQRFEQELTQIIRHFQLTVLGLADALQIRVDVFHLTADGQRIIGQQLIGSLEQQRSFHEFRVSLTVVQAERVMERMAEAPASATVFNGKFNFLADSNGLVGHNQVQVQGQVVRAANFTRRIKTQHPLHVVVTVSGESGRIDGLTAGFRPQTEIADGPVAAEFAYLQRSNGFHGQFGNSTHTNVVAAQQPKRLKCLSYRRSNIRVLSERR